MSRLPEARQLLLECRSVFENEGHTPGLGKAFSALADLEAEASNTSQSVHHEQTALRYKYIVSEPVDCAISHFNLAIYLSNTSAPQETALAHRLAAALLALQTSSGLFT